jgi:hypothetical protein
MIGRLLFSLRVNSPVTNLLAKQTHDCKSVSVSVGVSVTRTTVFLLPKEMGSGTAMGVCIKENETDCVWLAVLEEKELVTETERMSSTVTEKTKSLNFQRG